MTPEPVFAPVAETDAAALRAREIWLLLVETTFRLGQQATADALISRLVEHGLTPEDATHMVQVAIGIQWLLPCKDYLRVSQYGDVCARGSAKRWRAASSE